MAKWVGWYSRITRSMAMKISRNRSWRDAARPAAMVPEKTYCTSSPVPRTSPKPVTLLPGSTPSMQYAVATAVLRGARGAGDAAVTNGRPLALKNLVGDVEVGAHALDVVQLFQYF